MQTQKVSLEAIRRDGGTQPRSAIDVDAAYDYGESMASGAKFPPPVVFFDGENYWLADGFHRVFGAETAAGLKEIDCDVRQGTQADAQWFSYSVNQTNGLRRTNADKQRAVQAALRHPQGASLSDQQIAKHVGVAASTVGEWRKRLEPNLSLGKLEIGTRTVTRGGTTYQQDTSNIGKVRNYPATLENDVPAVPNRVQSFRQQTPVSAAPALRHSPALVNLSVWIESIATCSVNAAEYVEWMKGESSFDDLIQYLEEANETLRAIQEQAKRRISPCVVSN